MHSNRLPREVMASLSLEYSKPDGPSPEQPALVDSAVSRELDWMIPRDPFQPQ